MPSRWPRPPFATGQWKKGPSQWLPHVGLEAVRRANMEDPAQKIYDGRPAVTPAVA